MNIPISSKEGGSNSVWKGKVAALDSFAGDV